MDTETKHFKPRDSDSLTHLSLNGIKFGKQHGLSLAREGLLRLNIKILVVSKYRRNEHYEARTTDSRILCSLE